MLGCANWRGLRLVPRTPLFHFIGYFKRSFYSVLHLCPIYCFSKNNRAFGVALHQRDPSLLRAGSGSYFGVKLRVKCLPQESWMP